MSDRRDLCEFLEDRMIVATFDDDREVVGGRYVVWLFVLRSYASAAF